MGVDKNDPEIRRLDNKIDARAAYKTFEVVDVVFLGANTDLDVPHTLPVSDPTLIRYEVVRKDRACDVYDNRTPPVRAWTSTYLTLRCSVANAKVTLRVFVV